MKKKMSELLIEGLLIFTSVLCASWAENYRENIVEKRSYVSTLTQCRNEIHAKILEFRFTYDSTVDIPKQMKALPLLLSKKSEIEKIDSLLSDSNRKNDNQAVAAILKLNPWSNNWREKSNTTDRLNGFPDYIGRDSLNSLIETYSRYMNSNFAPYGDWNNILNKTKEVIEMNFDLKVLSSESPTLIDRLPVPDGNIILRLRNLNYRLLNFNYEAMSSDSRTASILERIVRKLDKKLIKNGVDISSLDKKYFLNSDNSKRSGR